MLIRWRPAKTKSKLTLGKYIMIVPMQAIERNTCCRFWGAQRTLIKTSDAFICINFSRIQIDIWYVHCDYPYLDILQNTHMAGFGGSKGLIKTSDDFICMYFKNLLIADIEIDGIW